VARDFTRRSRETELMETELVSLDDYRRCLLDLATVNRLTFRNGPILRFLDRATRNAPPGQRFTVLDVGYGYGDLLRSIHAWSRRRGRTIDLVGVDLDPRSETIACAATPSDAPIEYRTGNVFDFAPGRPVDVVVSSLLTHHLTDDELVAFVRWMERVAMRGWFVSDLHRHAVSFHAFRILSRLARWHRFVQHDGPVSIARSFRRDDWQQVLRTAGLASSAAQIRWHSFRLCVSRLR
jgi:SAM-dependent methyltransferase